MIAAWNELNFRVKLVTLYTVALALVLIPYAAGAYLFMRGYLLTQMDRSLHGEAEEAVLLVSEAALQSGSDPDVLRLALQRLEAVEDVQYELRTAAGELIFRKGMSPSVQEALPELGSTPTVYSIRVEDDDRFRVLEEPVAIAGQPYLFRVVSFEEPIRDTLIRLMEIQALGLGGALLLAAICGSYLARHVLKPIRLITDRARLLTSSRLKEGIPVIHPGDELGRLATTFNDVFRKLDESFERLSEFTADASHELRTPLAAIQGVAEVGLARDDAGKRDSLESILEETRRMRGILDGLLLLARAENRQLPLVPGAVELAGLCREVAGQLGVLAEDRAQTLQLEGNESVVVWADRSLVRHALLNVVDNAIKYGPGNSPIAIRTQRVGEQGEILVTDRGPGISAGDRERLFERFYQVDRERSRSMGGSGLGLSIASWAITANGGTIELDSGEGAGTTFRIRLPTAAGAGRSASHS